MKFTVFTLFPEYFHSALQCSLLGKAIESGLLSVDLVSLRTYGEGKWNQVDDRPFGGGQGMVLMPPVVERALEDYFQKKGMPPVDSVLALEKEVQDFRSAKSKFNSTESIESLIHRKSELPYVVYLSPQGVLLDSNFSKTMSSVSEVILLCGHYEGVDQRIIDSFVHEEVSIGDYILTGGEPASLVLIDSVSRFVSGVVGDPVSVQEDTFGSGKDMVPGGLKAPSYTRPQQWRNKSVPEVLLSGNHGEISKFRKNQSLELTLRKRSK